MGLQELERARRAHLRGDHARDVLLERHVVDDRQPRGAPQDAEGAAEDLPLLPLPVEADADRDVVEGEGRRRRVGGRERRLHLEAAPPGRDPDAGRVGELPEQLDLDRRETLHQADGDVQQRFSSRDSTSRNWSSGIVTSR